MPKRRSENGQLRREDYEALSEGPSEEMGTFRRASNEQLKRRKRVKVRRRRNAPAAAAGGAASSTQPPPVAAAASSTSSSVDSSNPFASVSFSAGAAAPAQPQPFPSPQSSVPAWMSAKPTAAVPSTASSSQDGASSDNAGGSGSGGATQLADLNAAFASWVEDQHRRNPDKSWAGGMGDYMKQLSSFQEHNTLVDKGASSTSAVAVDPAPKIPQSVSPPAAPASSPAPVTVSAPASASSSSSGPAPATSKTSETSSSGTGTGTAGDAVGTFRSKVRRWGKDAEGKDSWGELGICTVSIQSGKAGKAGYIVVRDTTPLSKVLVNASLYQGLEKKVEILGKTKNSLKLPLFEQVEERDAQGAVTGTVTKMRVYLMRVKNNDVASALQKCIQDNTAR